MAVDDHLCSSRVPRDHGCTAQVLSLVRRSGGSGLRQVELEDEVYRGDDSIWTGREVAGRRWWHSGARVCEANPGLDHCVSIVHAWLTCSETSAQLVLVFYATFPINGSVFRFGSNPKY